MEYIYDAFISYRHSELDKFVAENLHRQLEAFKLPRNLAKKESLKKKKIERVFRDRDELPLASNLEDPIVEALKSSEYLIVICSPRLRESIWCQKEIQTFIELHGRNKVFAVLVEGEPDESFPEELLHDSEGNLVEPLAADVRGKNKAEVKKLIKEEILRLLAPMFGLGYDDLRQRHKEQKMKRTAAIVSICGAVGIAFGLVCALAAIRINSQKKIIEEQNIVLAEGQAESLSKEALALYEDDNRYDSIELAYKAMTEYEGVKMPKSAYSESVLAECMSVYDGTSIAKSAMHIKTPGILKDMKVSPSGQFVMTVDNSGNLIVWDITKRESVVEIKEECDVTIFDFIDDEQFFYVTTSSGLSIGDISSKSVRKECDGEDIFFEIIRGVKLLGDKKHMALLKVNQVDIYDIETLKAVASFQGEKDGFIDQIFVSDKYDRIFATGKTAAGDSVCFVIDSNTGEKITECALTCPESYDACFGEDCIYILSSAVDFKTINLKSGITAIDLQTLKPKYSVEVPGVIAMTMNYSNGEGRENLLLESYSEMKLIDAKTGELRQSYFKDSKVAKVMTGSDGDFLVYTENGDCRSLDISDDLTDLTIPTIKSSNVLQLEATASGMVGRRKNDDRLVIYTFLRNKDAYEYTDELKEVEEEGLYLDNAISWAVENGIENPNFVNCCVTMSDLNMIVVGYVDGSLKVYDSETKELIHKYDSFNGDQFDYYGKVADYYLAGGYNVSYLFDKDGEIRAKISGLKGLSKDGKSIVVSGRNADAVRCDMAVPVYTQDKLLKKTKEYLEKYADK